MKFLALLLLLFVSGASANPTGEKVNVPLPMVGEKFELSFFPSFDTIDGRRTIKTVVKVGKPFEEKLISADDAYLKIKGTLQRAVDGEYSLALSYEDKMSGYGSRNYERNLKLTPGKVKTWTSGSSVISFYSAIITRMPNSTPQKSDDVVPPDNRDAAPSIEFAAELPFDAQIKREELTWGEEVDGLQLGIRLDFLNRPYRIGETAKFTLAVRNSTKNAVELTSTKSLSQIVPEVVHENGNPLSIFQQIYLLGAGNNIYFPSPPTKIAPGQVAEVATAYIDLGPMNGNTNPALDVTSGKFQVRYQFDFYRKNEDQEDPPKEMRGNLSSGTIMLEVIPILIPEQKAN